jgi:hypothetical protein
MLAPLETLPPNGLQTTPSLAVRHGCAAYWQHSASLCCCSQVLAQALQY